MPKNFIVRIKGSASHVYQGEMLAKRTILDPSTKGWSGPTVKVTKIVRKPTFGDDGGVVDAEPWQRGPGLSV
jgi:hypothetical protein